ncbi:MAG: response regulator [Magnetococcales bacterium]|nr:response regulator [Magnetococcales bacterium]
MMKHQDAMVEEGFLAPQVLLQFREPILDAWASKNKGTAQLQAGDMPDVKVHENRSRFLDALMEIYREEAGSGSDSSAIDHALVLCQETEGSHPQHNVSQPESAHFLFSLREAMLPFLQEVSGGSLDLFAKEMEQLNQVIDRLRLISLERHIRAREKVITEQGRAMIELAEASVKAKSLFLASMSHEIRTPISAILGMGELLAESDLKPDQAQYVRISNKAGETLLALINDILDLSKIEAGQLELESMPFNLTELIGDTKEILSLQARDKGLAMTLAPESFPSDLWVMGDPTRLQQVLLNLLSNAIKFTSEGKVSISLEKGKNGLFSISVSDTGIGIPEEKRQHVFQPFTQADASISRQYRGTGLGLAICRQLAEKMGGRIDLKSQVGVGSTFTLALSLPMADMPELAVLTGVERNTGTPGQDASSNKPLSILLADDAEENRILFEAFLKPAGYTLKMVQDGAEALIRFRQEDFDLVFTDIEMPVMDGYAATRAMRAWERENDRSATPIIALTAHAMREHAERSIEAGCDFHLTKPFRKSQLLECIERFGRESGSTANQFISGP